MEHRAWSKKSEVRSQRTEGKILIWNFEIQNYLPMLFVFAATDNGPLTTDNTLRLAVSPSLRVVPLCLVPSVHCLLSAAG
jgi:hypothetical protein